MSDTNEINKIKLNDTITVDKIGSTTLLFIDNCIVSKTLYSVVDKFINIKTQMNNNLNLFYLPGKANYFEYNINLRNGNTTITGYDKFRNTLSGLLNNNCLLFVNGYKLLPSEFTIVDDNTLIIKNKYTDKITSSVIIYLSQNMAYLGKVTDDPTWDENNNKLEIKEYDFSRYLFFKNGKQITHDQLIYSEGKLKINEEIRINVDIIEFYLLPTDTKNCLFYADPGYFSYGPKDTFEQYVPDLYDTLVTFSDHIARLSVDNIRPGFFIKEEQGNGCLIVVDDIFEKHSIKCLEITPFNKDKYTTEEYFLQVPRARSILKYVSEFDLSGKLFPELLGVFQRTLLDETYDSVQRLRNIRSINNVDSNNINNLIEFLGVKLNIKNMTLEEKHALLEELNNFYKIVGTKTSYNFYNVSSKNSRIVNLEQLFTPIKDISSGKDPVQRYVTFRTAEELGAKYHREYVFPYDDYGDVGTLANPEDSLTNTPNSPGMLEDQTRPCIINEYNPVWVTNDQGESIQIMKKIRTNKYSKIPVPGPNLPTVDYGSVSDDKPTDFYDYGYVWEVIKGKWIEWFEWDRPTNWYPTNHVNVSVEIPPEVDYDTFMNEFKKTFYDIASTVLYIHNVIDVYTFGDDKQWEEGQRPTFGIMTSSLYHSTDYTFTNNPTIKAFIPIA